MDPAALRRLLQDLCGDLEQGRPVKRWRCTAGGALVLAGLAGGLQACEEEGTPVYGAPAPWEEDCADGQDDDDDGMTDCEDGDCYEVCGDTDGSPQAERDCADGLDNDHDGDTDCYDYDCDDDPACIDDALYGVPLVEWGWERGSERDPASQHQAPPPSTVQVAFDREVEAGADEASLPEIDA